MDLLFEIGTEEMPASAAQEAVEELESHFGTLLENSGLCPYDELRVLGGPRRIALLCFGMPSLSAERATKKKGPPLAKSKGEDGEWTAAAVGFARSQGVEPADLLIEKTDKGEYLFAVTKVEGVPARDILPQILLEAASSIHFSRSMRWDYSEVRFSRPVRWLVALADKDILPVEFAGVSSGNISRGHRYLSGGPATIDIPRNYEKVLEENHVVADHHKRKSMIQKLVSELCEAHGTKPVMEENVMGEVVHLVEYPEVLLGKFEPRFLGLPREVLEHVMEVHQRYFPVEDSEGRLTNMFVVVHNGTSEFEDTIRRGHERVLAARLQDAQFFFTEDIKEPLSSRFEDLERVVYQSELGSMAEKSRRLISLVEKVGKASGFGGEVIERAKRAAYLAKCDLVTNMVKEFTDLEGTMGSIYARMSGEEEAVSAAIAEQYLPRRAGDSLPLSQEGALLSLCEKVDNLVASFGLGYVPSGSEDPYGLRRQALGILQIIIERGLPLSISQVARWAAEELESQSHGFSFGEASREAFEEFFKARERLFLVDEGYRYDLAQAALGSHWDRPLFAMKALDALSEARSKGSLERLYTAFERCYNLSRGQETVEVDDSLICEEAERGLFDLLEKKRGVVEELVETGNFKEALFQVEDFCQPVDRFFDDVLVMEEDAALRRNRLSLIAAVSSLFNKIARFSELKWDQVEGFGPSSQ